MPAERTNKVPRLRAPLVGRDHELELLEATLVETIGSRSPHMVTLVGPAGVGKTRLLREFLTNVRTREDGPRVYNVLSRADGLAFAPIRSLLRDRFGIGEAADERHAVQRLRRTVVEVIGEESVSDFLHFLGSFLGLQLPDSPLVRAVESDTQQGLHVQRAVLRRFLEMDAQAEPLLLAFEDFHHAHAPTVELLEHLVASLQDAPIMMVFVTRPELMHRRPAWVRGDNHLRFDLSPLDHEDAAELLEHLLDRAEQIPDDMVGEAVDLAGGNPYLLEQLVRAFIDQGAVEPRAEGPWRVYPERLDASALPLTVDDAIEARIAGLRPPERALLEMAAALGGVFWSGALVALERAGQSPPARWKGSEEQRDRIERTLHDLIARDYLLPMPDSTIPGEKEYAFKHNLERESLHRDASASLLRQYHLRIAQWLECRLPRADEEYCTLLAQHYEQGGEGARAARYYLAAARLARARYSAGRACEYYAHGLRLLPEPVSVERLDALEQNGDVLHQARRADDALVALDAAKGLAYQLDLPERGARIYMRCGKVHRVAGRLARAADDYDTALALFDGGNDPEGALDAAGALTDVETLRGRFSIAEQLVAQTLSRLRKQPGRPARLARCQMALGALCREARRYEEADRAFAQALENFRNAQDTRGVAEVLCLRGVVASQRGNLGDAETLWRQGLEAARRSGDRFREVIALTCLGSAGYRNGKPDAAVALLQQAARLNATLGDRLQEADTLRSLAKARLLSGDPAGAYLDVRRACVAFEQAGSRPHLGVALRTMGEIVASGDWEGKPAGIDAAHLFERSIAIFEETRNQAEQARSFLTYSELLARQARAPDADATTLRRRAEAMRERALALLGNEPPGSVPPGVSFQPSSEAGRP